MARRLLAWIFLLAAPASAGAEGIPLTTDTLSVAPDRQVACLGRSFVFASTFILEEGDRRLEPGIHYVLDADAGCLTLLEADTLEAGRTFIARYRALPLALQGNVRLAEDPHRRRRGQETPGSVAGAPPVAFTEGETTEGLDFSGSKTFGIEVGNRRDLKLRQSLDLRLTGQVTHDVSLVAILSDQDVPFQPEGNTAEIDELDRVLIELKSPRAGASLGDVDFATSGMTFLQVERKVEGFTGHAMFRDARGTGALASAKGEYASRQFFGTDGKQGPYLLTNRSDDEIISVVGGSERVWLDGALLARGEENDYVIDYGRGEITFTSQRVVTASTEITVDYQFVTGRYSRDIAFGGAESGKLGRAGTLRGGYYSEGDDPDDPVGGDLTENERAELAALGDSAQVSGGTERVEDGTGDYELLIDAETGREIFVYVEGTGSFQVVFVNVGDGKGEYEPDPELSASKAVYRFVGEGLGRYNPRRDLPAPVKRELGDVQWSLEGERGLLRMEGGVSNLDGNVLSPLDDDDNVGGAFTAEGRLQEASIGKAIRVTPRFLARRVGASFQSPSRFREAFYSRDWNLTGTETIRDESLLEGALGVKLREALRWDVSVGRLALADTFEAIRQSQALGWTHPWVASSLDWTTSRDEVRGREGALDRTRAEALLTRYRVQPRLRGLHETRRRAATITGERHREWEAALVFPMGAWPLSGEVGGGRRLDDSLQVAEDAWRDVRDSRRIFGRLEGRWSPVSLTLRYEARRVDEGGEPERRDSGRLDFRHQAVRGAWTAVLTTDLGTVGLRRRTKTIVADSTGYFDRFGNYVGPGGGYDVDLGPLSEEELTGRIDLSTRLRWSPPGEDVPVAPMLRTFAWEGFVNLSEASSLPLVKPSVFLDPSSYMNRESTLAGRVNARQIVDVYPRAKKLGLRLRHELSRTLTQNPQEGSDESFSEYGSENTFAATLRANPSEGWDSELEGSLGSRTEEVSVGSGGAFVQETDLRAATARGGRRFSALSGSGRISAEVTYSTETGEDREATGWTVRPRGQWSIAGKGRLDVRYAWTRFTELSGFTGISGPGAPSLTEGQRLDVIGEHRITRNIVLTGAVLVNAPQGLDRIVEGRMEVRGSF